MKVNDVLTRKELWDNMLEINVVDSIAQYIEILYNTNKMLIKLWGVNLYNCSVGSELLLQIIHNIPQLLPYSFDDKTKKLKLSNKDGLLNFKNEIDYLYDDYRQILDQNHRLLQKIRIIRNKKEHELHILGKSNSFGDANNGSFHYFYEVGNKILEFKSDEMTFLVKKLNILFSKLVLEIKNYAELSAKTEYPLYNKISRFDFIDFNKIYESDLLHKVGVIEFDY